MTQAFPRSAGRSRIPIILLCLISSHSYSQKCKTILEQLNESLPARRDHGANQYTRSEWFDRLANTIQVNAVLTESEKINLRRRLDVFHQYGGVFEDGRGLGMSFLPPLSLGESPLIILPGGHLDDSYAYSLSHELYHFEDWRWSLEGMIQAGTDPKKAYIYWNKVSKDGDASTLAAWTEDHATRGPATMTAAPKEQKEYSHIRSLILLTQNPQFRQYFESPDSPNFTAMQLEVKKRLKAILKSQRDSVISPATLREDYLKFLDRNKEHMGSVSELRKALNSELEMKLQYEGSYGEHGLQFGKLVKPHLDEMSPGYRGFLETLYDVELEGELNRRRLEIRKRYGELREMLAIPPLPAS